MKQNSDLRKLYRVLKKVNNLKSSMEALSDAELSKKTEEFRGRYRDGESLDSIMAEAFAAMREADRRILGKFPYDVQVLGAAALHYGYFAEMNTGEGKTLCATLPLYLNALTGDSAILLTANDYLVERDEEEMRPVYNFMGLTSSRRLSDDDENLKKQLYSADIVYTTHGTLGFDYLFNNLVKRAEDRFLRPFNYVIIDEADSVLLDAAQTPLVIAGSPRVQSNLYGLADFFVSTLKEVRDYEVEDKKVWLTEEGVKYAERFFRIDNFYGEEFFEINRHVVLALRAHAVYEPEKEYMLTKDGELVLLDGGSGRAMPGVKLRGGQHQAVEVKEGIEASMENRSVASITYQNLFKLFPKMAGMSGTISNAKEELFDVYGIKTVIIPPNCRLQRIDYKDEYFLSPEEQVEKAISVALKSHESGQPVLFVVSTISDTEIISRILVEEGVPHNVLNANNAYWEAQIIKEAGQKNAVTVATSMAGRGTDIKLGEGVAELGGLAVIGIGRMENIRLERQARGRSGRQGDPGYSRFFVCVEDEVVRTNTPDLYEKYVKKRNELSNYRMKKLINGAQKLGEENAVSSRRQATQYDQVMLKQRRLIYDMRNNLLDGEKLNKKKITRIARQNIKSFMENEYNYDEASLNRFILDNISYRLDKDNRSVDYSNAVSVEVYLRKKVNESLKRQELHLNNNELFDYFLRVAVLSAIDEAWIEQVDYLQQLQSAVSGRSSAQRNPVFEYEKEALESFKKMKCDIISKCMKNVLLSELSVGDDGQLYVIFP